MIERFGRKPKTAQEITKQYEADLAKRLEKDSKRMAKGKRPKHTTEYDRMTPEQREQESQRVRKELFRHNKENNGRILVENGAVLRNLGEFAAGKLLIIGSPRQPDGFSNELDRRDAEKMKKIVEVIGALTAGNTVTMSMHYHGAARRAEDSRRSARILYADLAYSGVKLARDRVGIVDIPYGEDFGIRGVAEAAFRGRERAGDDSYHVAVVGTTWAGDYLEPDNFDERWISSGSIYQVDGVREDGHLAVVKILDHNS
jgi:hypothetical protein